MLRRNWWFLPRPKADIAADVAENGDTPGRSRAEKQEREGITLTCPEFNRIRGVLGAIEHDYEAGLKVHEESDMEPTEEMEKVKEAIRSDLKLVQSAQKALFSAEERSG